jgi:hypothetical protein
VITDVQYSANSSVSSRFATSSLSKLTEAVTILKNDSVEFMINLGDLIDNNFLSFEPVLAIIGSSSIKTYHITGNHDYSIEPELRQKLPVLAEFKKGYYSFTYENFRFIFLNGNEISTYSSDNEAIIREANDQILNLQREGDINGIDWNGGIGKQQVIWFTDQLNESEGKGEKVFILCHFPVAPENKHNLLNYKEILQILSNRRNVIVWFNGHNHQGNYCNFNAIHFVTLKGMVETESENSFARIDVYSDKIRINGYGREVSRTLNLKH